MTDFDDPRENEHIAPLHPAALESIIGQWMYQQTFDSTSIAMLLKECVRASRNTDAMLLANAVRELLKGGEHEGPCTNEDDFEGNRACDLHIETCKRREKEAEELLRRLNL